MDRRFIAALLSVLLIIILVLGVYYIGGIEDTVVDEEVVEPYISQIIEGNSNYENEFDDYIDPLDLEISELEYKDETQYSDGSNNDGVIECVEDFQCGLYYVDEAYCLGDNLYADSYTYTCDGQCHEEVDRVLVEDCLVSCADGACLDSFLYPCDLDLDCDFNDYVGDRYCLPDDNVHQYYANWICINPGTAESACQVQLEEREVDVCGDDLTCSNGYCIDE